MRTCVLALLLLGGCDSLFNLDHVPPGGGGGSDGSMGDDDAAVRDGDPLMADAADCGTFDEDADGRMDGCDLCPTVAGSEADADLDGLPDACDPDLGTGQKDKILFAALFSDPLELGAKFDSTNTENMFPSSLVYVNGTGALAATMTTKVSLAPTRIVLNITGVEGGGYSAIVAVSQPSITAEVHAAGCDQTTLTQTCFLTQTGSGFGILQTKASNVTRIELSRNAGGTSTVFAVTASSTTGIGSTAQLSQAPITVTATAISGVKILNMVVYGSGP